MTIWLIVLLHTYPDGRVTRDISYAGVGDRQACEYAGRIRAIGTYPILGRRTTYRCVEWHAPRGPEQRRHPAAGTTLVCTVRDGRRTLEWRIQLPKHGRAGCWMRPALATEAALLLVAKRRAAVPNSPHSPHP